MLIDINRSIKNGYTPREFRMNSSHLQGKLTIGQPGDKYEQEADEVAAQVVQRINEPQTPSTNKSTIQTRPFPVENQNQQNPETNQQFFEFPRFKPGETIENINRSIENGYTPRESPLYSIQRKSATPIPEGVQRESVEEMRRKESETSLQGSSELSGGIQRQMIEGSKPNVQADFETSLNQAKGGGSSLDKAFREKVEPEMGADFSDVKVHSGSEADKLSKEIQAKAFTTGQDIFFRQGEYEPGSRGGQELLAHELTHVVQQNQGVRAKSDIKGFSQLSSEEQLSQLNQDQDLLSQNPFSNPGRYSGLMPWKPRSKNPNDNDESQRQKSITIVEESACDICEVAEQYNVPAEAIAGAILWEGIENPYPALRSWYFPEGPVGGRTNITGKIHPYEGSIAEEVEREGRVPPLVSSPSVDLVAARTYRLRHSYMAIVYIAAILDREAERFQTASRSTREQLGTLYGDFYIRDQAGLLCAFYQGVDPIGAAVAMERRRAFFSATRDLENDTPRPDLDRIQNAAMGAWVSEFRWWIREILFQSASGCSCNFSGDPPAIPPSLVPVVQEQFPHLLDRYH